MSDDNFFEYTGEPPEHWPEWMKDAWNRANEFVKGTKWEGMTCQDIQKKD